MWNLSAAVFIPRPVIAVAMLHFATMSVSKYGSTVQCRMQTFSTLLNYLEVGSGHYLGTGTLLYVLLAGF